MRCDAMRCDGCCNLMWCNVQCDMTVGSIHSCYCYCSCYCMLGGTWCTVLILFVACKLWCSYTLLYSTVQKSSTDSTDSTYSIVPCKRLCMTWHDMMDDVSINVPRSSLVIWCPLITHYTHAPSRARTQNQFSQHSNNMVNQHHLFIIKHQHDW